MLKMQVTKKQLKHSYDYIISVGYCKCDFLVNHQISRYYYSNNLGWRFDVYELGYNCILTTGYEYLKENKDQQEFEAIVEKYDKKAKEIVGDFSIYSTDKLQENWDNFVNEIYHTIYLKNRGLDNDNR